MSKEMAERTNLAEILTHVFQKLEQSIPNTPHNAPTLLQAWTAVLGGPERTPLDVVASIGQLSSILIKLETQIRESKKLKDYQINSALHCVAQFKIYFAIERFNENSHPHKQNCNELNRGHLGIVGISLEAEFSEPKLEAHDAEELIAELNAIKDILAKSVIPIDLRINLTKHVNAMIWWLSHPDMVSIQDVFETSGSAILIAQQMRDRDPDANMSQPTQNPSITVYEKVVWAATKLGKLVGLTSRGIEAADRISSDAHHLLGSINLPT